ncbi:MAG: ABC-F family ATP-binding cassette domain-containing protein [Candidatus Methanomethylophilaceae archaeon]|nr:ABC-F family ATP-binding cassette domain-containing protein [Candidatus Methanomethylophilaceae archaeon]
MLLKAQSISKSFGPVKVLEDASLQINEGDRIALVGTNGAGKSTFLRILLGDEKADTGELTRRTSKIGYMKQFADVDMNGTVREILTGSYRYVEDIRKRMAEIDEAMMAGGDVDWNALAEESADLESKISKFDSEIEGKLEGILAEIGFPKDSMGRVYSSLSGGERTKVMLAKLAVQISDCDLLMLDEPTSHLDIDTIEWMENAILSSDCAVVVVSHDRYFLDRIAQRTMEIENGKSREYKGNYSAYVEKKNLDIERQNKEYERYQAQKKKQEAIAEQMFHDQRRYMSDYKTRLMMVSKIEKKEKAEEQKEITVKIQAARKSGKNVLMAENLSIGYEGKTVLRNVNLEIDKGDKLGIFGPNGAGKSSLLKAILGEIPCEGSLWVAPGAKIGYYSQNHENLDMNLTAEEQILLAIGPDRKADARNMLARFLLFGDDVTRKINTLSGGQRARVSMCLLLHGETNLLVLDEPTNYVDIQSKHILEQALAEYDGTVIAVTHDRYFLDNVCDRVAEVKDGTVTVYSGNYTDLKGKPEPKKTVSEGAKYKVLAPFTNWVTNTKYAKGDKVTITEEEMKGFENAMNQGKLKKLK